MYTAIRTLKETESLTKYGTYIREFKIMKKYPDKLRKRYKNFSFTRFDEWHFNSSLSIALYYYPTISIIIVIITGHVIQTLYLEMKKIVFKTSGYNHPIISLTPLSIIQ